MLAKKPRPMKGFFEGNHVKNRNYSGAIEIASIGLKPNVRLRGQSDF
jgi:hypothetical protein